VEPADEDLMLGLGSGDAAAFGALYDRHAHAIYTYGVRRGLHSSEAEDLMSMVFLEAWRCRSELLLVEESLRPWLLGIARNLALRFHRSTARHQAALGRYAQTQEQVQPDHADSVARSVDASSDALRIREAFGQLPRRDRDVADLCLMAGLTTAAASLVLQIPEGTVKSRLSRARGKLQRLLHSSELMNYCSATGDQPVKRQPVAMERSRPR
jgi:RNA polymerase sigma factor (sigma-70 family)